MMAAAASWAKDKFPRPAKRIPTVAEFPKALLNSARAPANESTTWRITTPPSASIRGSRTDRRPTSTQNTAKANAVPTTKHQNAMTPPCPSKWSSAAMYVAIRYPITASATSRNQIRSAVTRPTTTNAAASTIIATMHAYVASVTRLSRKSACSLASISVVRRCAADPPLVRKASGLPSIDVGGWTPSRSRIVGATSTRDANPARRVVPESRRPGLTPGALTPATVRASELAGCEGPTTTTASRLVSTPASRRPTIASVHASACFRRRLHSSDVENTL